MYSAKLAGEIRLDSRQPTWVGLIDALRAEDMKRVKLTLKTHKETEVRVNRCLVHSSSVRPMTYLS